jgi:hypothetical protein
MAQLTGNARNILVGASPLFISNIDSTTSGYATYENSEPGTTNASAFVTGTSYTDTLNATSSGAFYYRNVGYTNNGLQITYNPTFDSVTVDQLLDTAKLFKSAMEVMIMTEMSEGTLENVLVVFGQGDDPTNDAAITQDNTIIQSGTGTAYKNTLGIAAGALGIQPTERQLIAIGQAPTTQNSGTANATQNVARAERIYYARRVLSVQQSQFTLARNTPTTFPVTFRLLPSGETAYAGQEYGKIIDRVLSV